MTARYTPFGRTAVSLVAGAVHYPHKQFWPRSLVSTFVWAVYSCLIGAVAGAWFTDHHLLGITVALVTALVLALAIGRASCRGGGGAAGGAGDVSAEGGARGGRR